MRRLLHNLLTSALGLVFALLLLEGGLSLCPVNEGLGTLPVNDTSPVLRFTQNRTSTWSRGPDFAITNQVHANNDGFINNQDYAPDAPGPLIAVVGDSYVEAAMVPYERTFFGLLANALSPHARVYSFGASGAPLSQYLAYARYARDTYAPERLIVTVVGNDFDESLLTPASRPGFHYFRDRDGQLELTRVDYAPSTLAALAHRSQLLRYLVFNLEVTALAQRFATIPENGQETYVGQTRADASGERLASSRRAVDAFLARLPAMSGLDPAHILLVVDGIRPALYDPDALSTTDQSYFGKMRLYLMERAEAAGFRVLDMQPVFKAGHKATGPRYEFDHDAHWNGAGHEAVARAIVDSNFLDGYGADPAVLSAP